MISRPTLTLLRTVLILTLVAVSLQLLAEITLKEWPRGDIHFPLQIGQQNRAGAPLNLIGFGKIQHDGSVPRALTGMLVALVILLARVWSPRYGRVIPSLLIAGSFANNICLLMSGYVLDFIIFPMGGDIVKGVSPGDLLLFFAVPHACMRAYEITASNRAPDDRT